MWKNGRGGSVVLEPPPPPRTHRNRKVDRKIKTYKALTENVYGKVSL